jgi:hypothetical protein
MHCRQEIFSEPHHNTLGCCCVGIETIAAPQGSLANAMDQTGHHSLAGSLDFDSMSTPWTLTHSGRQLTMPSKLQPESRPTAAMPQCVGFRQPKCCIQNGIATPAYHPGNTTEGLQTLIDRLILTSVGCGCRDLLLCLGIGEQ